MKIGVRCNPLRCKNDLPKLFAWLADHGFGSVDLMSADATTLKLANDHKLTPGTFDLPGVSQLMSPDNARRREAVVQVIEGLKLAGELGLKTCFVCFVPEDRNLPRAENFRLWCDSMPEIVAVAEAKGIRFAMEGWPGPAPAYPTLGCTPEMWRAMFAAIPSPALGICFDPSHLVRIGIDHMRVLAEFGSRIHHVHGKDCAFLPEEQYLQGNLTLTFGKPAFGFSEGGWRYCIPGDGEVNWRNVVTQLTSIGYDGPISVELEDGMYMADDEANYRGLQAAATHLQSAIR